MMTAEGSVQNKKTNKQPPFPPKKTTKKTHQNIIAKKKKLNASHSINIGCFRMRYYALFFFFGGGGGQNCARFTFEKKVSSSGVASH